MGCSAAMHRPAKASRVAMAEAQEPAQQAREVEGAEEPQEAAQQQREALESAQQAHEVEGAEEPQEAAQQPREAAEPEDKTTVDKEWDLARYQEAESIFDALGATVDGLHPVRLVRMSWLLQQRGSVLRKRQELPEAAFISADDLRAVWQDGGCGGSDKVMPIVTISFCWDTREHPDPTGSQLNLIVDTLSAESSKYATANYDFKGFRDMGVFWDWPSLLQGDLAEAEKARTAARAEGKTGEAVEDAAWKAFRTPAEKGAFDYALHKTMDLWYAHQLTTVFLLTQHPRERGSAREKGYEESGWTTYERCSAEQIKKVYRCAAEWSAVMDIGNNGQDNDRRWPVGPDAFDQMMESCTFTNGADKGVVKELFRDMSEAQLGGVTELDFTGMPPPSRDDMARLAECLRLCANLETLDCTGVEMDGGGLAELVDALSSGKLATLKKLVLSGVGLDDKGGAALAKALPAVPALKELHLDSNGIGPEGGAALARALPAVPALEVLGLSHNGIRFNGIGSEAEAALREAWGQRPGDGLQFY